MSESSGQGNISISANTEAIIKTFLARSDFGSKVPSSSMFSSESIFGPRKECTSIFPSNEKSSLVENCKFQTLDHSFIEQILQFDQKCQVETKEHKSS